MNTITSRHLMRERTKTKRRISFSIHPVNAMPATWSDFELHRELMRFGERKDQLKLLEEEHKEHSTRLLEHFKANKLGEPVDISSQRFSCKPRTSKTYSRHLEREEALMKSKIKSMKVQEEKNAADPDYDGPHQCQIEVAEFHHMEVRQLEPSE